MKILVVDESRVMRQLVIRTLRQAGAVGHQVVQAGNGHEGLQAVQQHDPDLVLSEWDMPEMTGIDLLGALRARGLTVPFGFVTSEGGREVVDRAEAAGALFVITKPFTAETFRAGLDALRPAPVTVVPAPHADSHAPQPTVVANRSSALTPLPAPKDVRDLLQQLLGRGVEVAPSDPYAPQDGARATLAVYVDDQLRTCAVAVADLPFSAYAGAAIGLVPVGGAEAALEEAALSRALRENLYEVLDVAAALLNAEGVPRVKLYAVHAPGEIPPIDVSGFARTLGRRLDLSVDIAGYGAGRFSVVGLGLA